MLILSREDVEASLDPERLVEALSVAMVELSKGKTAMAARATALIREHGGLLGAMTGFVPSRATLATKLVSVYPDNPARGIPSHQAVILVFEAETGRILACMDGTAITAVRTAAGSALATRHLAREDAAVLSIVGTGVQAAMHARALTRVRPFEEILVWGRTPRHVERFAAALGGELGLPVVPSSVENALARADVVAATTHAAEPVVLRAHLKEGTHINAVGLNLEGREVEQEVVRDAVVVVESRAAALAPPSAGGANDLTQAIEDAVIDEEEIVEIGEVIDGMRSGRDSDEQITLYRSVGVSVQDAVAASLVLEAAQAAGRGTFADLGSDREAKE